MLAYLCKEYGWTIDYVENLSVQQANIYHKSAVTLRAKERLHELAVASYPNMEKEARKDYKRQIQKEANPSELIPEVSASDMAKKLGKKHGGFGN